jgi:5'-nucleotidase (lipoprotein e(P4) family)
MSVRFSALVTVLSLAAAACGAPDGPGADTSEAAIVQPAATPAVAPGPMSKEIHWFRNSAEYRAMTRQVYAIAGRTLDANAAARKGTAWGVVLDIDETVLDNSTYQKEHQGQPYSAEAWTQWVNRKEAKAVPGARAFTKHVHELGGRVVLVSNRMDGTECPATEVNLAAENITYDAIFCKKDSSDKNARFKAVASGTAAAGLPALEIVAFVGDNIQDFPDQTQELAGKDDAAFAEFGTKLFVLPNPMYGSWEKNAQN